MTAVPKVSLVARVIVAAALLSLVLTSTATAASTIGITAGPDPVESITTQLGVTGVAAGAPSSVSLTVKPAGGEGCAANSQADGGTTVIGPYHTFPSGPYNESVNWTSQSAGSFLLCAWITDNPNSGNTVVATASLTINVRPPHIALSISAPPTVQPEQTFQITTVAQSETSRNVEEMIVPNTGRGCPANAEAGERTADVLEIHNVDSAWVVTGGPFTETKNVTLRTAGAYLVCAYAQYPQGGSVPEASATASINVVVPPPPCVVPTIRPGTLLKTAEHRISSAHCVAGRLSYAHSARYRRGTVIRLSPKSGTRHAPQASVVITVSTGRPKHHKR